MLARGRRVSSTAATRTVTMARHHDNASNPRPVLKSTVKMRRHTAYASRMPVSGKELRRSKRSLNRHDSEKGMFSRMS